MPTSQLNDTSVQELDSIVAAAADAFAELSSAPLGLRAKALRGSANALEAATAKLVSTATAETRLPESRLRAEVERTTGQLRFFADVIEEGSFLEATIDVFDSQEGKGRPDMRRMLVPLGPVVVFGAGNFPFAFGVAGGDTASALATGCPVIMKAHPGHPRLAASAAEILTGALTECGLPTGTFSIVWGEPAGRRALVDRRVAAAAFTGSTAAGRTLFDLASARPDPIPFYGELGSLNPVFVTLAAVGARGHDIVRGFVESFTSSLGQLCTKPGLIFLPTGHGLMDELADAVRRTTQARMLQPRIRSGFDEALTEVSATPSVDYVVDGRSTSELTAATLLRTTASAFLVQGESMMRECFGPSSVVVEYASTEELLSAVRTFKGELTATVHAESDEDLAQTLVALAARTAGRVVWNGWPTGVSVGWATQHGGPYPATTASLFSSVGAAALRRFLRPVCYQHAPEHLLPEALHNRNQLAIPRRVNGLLTRADAIPQ